MNVEQLERAKQFFDNATPDDILDMAQKMADKEPGLLIGIPEPRERAKALVKLEFLADEPNKEYIKGLVDGLWFGKLLTDDERKDYLEQAENL